MFPAVLPVAAPAEARIDVSGAVALVSDYRFRGISLSAEHPALQPTLTAQHSSGLYAGLWTSNLDGFGELGGSNLELDFFGGLRRPLAGGSADVGLLYYAYPGSSGGDYEFFEPYLNFSRTFGPVTAKVSAAFAPAQAALGGNSNVYLAADASASIPRTPLSVRAHVGRSSGDTPLSPGGGYFEWQIGGDLVWRNLTLGISYVDTDIDAREAASAGATGDIVDGAVILSLSASF